MFETSKNGSAKVWSLPKKGLMERTAKNEIDGADQMYPRDCGDGARKRMLIGPQTLSAFTHERGADWCGFSGERIELAHDGSRLLQNLFGHLNG